MGGATSRLSLRSSRATLQDIVHEDNRAGEVIQRLRGLLKTGRAKVGTGQRQRSRRFDDRKAGAVDFLTKPVSDQDLFDAIARAEQQDDRAARRTPSWRQSRPRSRP
jgi:DNA-binding NtrC family response regulator